MNRESFNTFAEGYFDAKFDRSEGWLPSNYTADDLRGYLPGQIGCSDEYLEGYIFGAFE